LVGANVAAVGRRCDVSGTPFFVFGVHANHPTTGLSDAAGLDADQA
jgi:hypothetical protein